MAAGLGIAAGAFAQNYARAMGLRSQLDDAAQQRELRQLQIDQEKAMSESRKEIAQDYKNFLDPNFDYVSGKPMEQPTGLIEPGQEAPKPVNPFKDTARLNTMYERQGALLERQAALAGKNPAAVRAEMDALRKNQFVEKVGGALSLIEAGDEAGIKQLQAVYDLYPDGRKITGGKINQDGSVLLQYEQGGKPGERVISRNQLLEFSKLALNPADAAKLRFQLTEKQKDRDFESGQLDKKLVSNKEIADNQNRSQERIGDARNKTAIETTGMEGRSRVEVANINASASGRASAEASSDRLLEQRQRSLREGYGTLINRQLDSLKADRNWGFKSEAERQQAIMDLERNFMPSRAVGEANVRFGAPADADLIHKVFNDSRNPKYMGFVMGENGGVKVKKDPVTGQFYGLTQSGVYVPAPTGMKFQ